MEKTAEIAEKRGLFDEKGLAFFGEFGQNGEMNCAVSIHMNWHLQFQNDCDIIKLVFCVEMPFESGKIAALSVKGRSICLRKRILICLQN